MLTPISYVATLFGVVGPLVGFFIHLHLSYNLYGRV